jgi:hypothetical protein
MGSVVARALRIAERTARLYMRLARHREKIENGNVADVSIRGAVAMIAAPKVSKDELTADLIAEVVEITTYELDLAAFEAAQDARKNRVVAFTKAIAALERIVALAEASPAAHAVAHDAEQHQLCDTLMSAVAEANASFDSSDEPFDLYPVATVAAFKAKNIAAKMLGRVEAAHA